ncbi:unannotated protein [freshwater metagenome]|uniref:Unannotated protein n=1 Tax=freshwater metagenome TaxID=449393 RepID=A0A6J7J3A7_9ZZZZ
MSPTLLDLPRSGAIPVTQAARDLLALAARGLTESTYATDPSARYSAAHLAALRAAAAVLAARARPTARRRVRSVWVLLPAVAPGLGEWATFFAGGAAKRAAAEAGIAHVVTEREADDLLRDSERFVALVADLLGLPLQQAMPRAVSTVSTVSTVG